MARKSRLEAYLNNVTIVKKQESTPKSVLKRLKEFKHQEFVMRIPIGDQNGEG